jgi:hypothetical protein
MALISTPKVDIMAMLFRLLQNEGIWRSLRYLFRMALISMPKVDFHFW